jgi:hypothetical protein
MGGHRSTLSLQKVEVTIHVYDLLPVSSSNSHAAGPVGLPPIAG